MKRCLIHAAAVLSLAATQSAAAADSVAIVTGGDPARSGDVISSAHDWLATRRFRVVESALDLPASEALIDCFARDDDECARRIVANVRSDEVIVVVIQPEPEIGDQQAPSALTLVGALYTSDGAVRAQEKRYCERCDEK